MASKNERLLWIGQANGRLVLRGQIWLFDQPFVGLTLPYILLFSERRGQDETDRVYPKWHTMLSFLHLHARRKPGVCAVARAL